MQNKYNTSTMRNVLSTNIDGREHQRAVTRCLSPASCFLLLSDICLWLIWLYETAFDG